MTDTMTWRYIRRGDVVGVRVYQTWAFCGTLTFPADDFNTLRLKLAGLVLFVDETPVPAEAGRGN